jgi:hypothetical protein
LSPDEAIYQMHVIDRLLRRFAPRNDTIKGTEIIKGDAMAERMLRGIAGLFILVSLLLAVYVSKYWLFFTAFVGLNLLQSAFTNWCPMITILKKAGVR